MPNNLEKNENKEMTTNLSLILLLGLAGFVSFSMLYLQLPTRLTLLLSIVLISIVCLFLGHKAKEVESYIVIGIKKCGFVIAILMIIGCVIGSWIISGIIPSIVYYGLDVLTPTTFLIGGLVSCSLVSYFTGSSYACIGTIGVALMGIGQGLGLPLPLTAGLVLSGAVFGDKMSPFSDTTNLAAASAGTPLFSHIHSMLYSTVPAWIIAAVLFLYFGSTNIDTSVNTNSVTELQLVIKAHFNVSPYLLLVPIFTIFLAIKKVPSLIAMAFGAMLGIITAFIFQENFSANTILISLISGLNIDLGSEEANQLFANRGGLSSMLYAMTIAIMALILGEILMRLGMLSALIRGAEKFIISSASLVICSIVTCIATVMISASEYLSIVMPGEALRLLYKNVGSLGRCSRVVLKMAVQYSQPLFLGARMQYLLRVHWVSQPLITYPYAFSLFSVQSFQYCMRCSATLSGMIAMMKLSKLTNL
ncbi:MAG: Na+/H+ antiporter NhaC family protein [Enterobacterales bacterium]|nr:Na+/H+ antiporter NhaC family protein [Enterobacterales bacterium]